MLIRHCNQLTLPVRMWAQPKIPVYIIQRSRRLRRQKSTHQPSTKKHAHSQSPHNLLSYMESTTKPSVCAFMFYAVSYIKCTYSRESTPHTQRASELASHPRRKTHDAASAVVHLWFIQDPCWWWWSSAHNISRANAHSHHIDNNTQRST